MLKTISNLIYYPLFLCIALFGFSSSNASFAQNPELNDSIVKEIESTLLFDESNDDIRADFFKKKTTKKSSIIINRASDEIAINKPKSSFKIDIVEKKVNLDLREKERIAYNATLIEQYEVAVKLFRDVILDEPDNSYAKFSLAVIYQKLGQFNQAKVLYRDILKSDPENKDDIIENMLSMFIEETPRSAVYLLSRLESQNPTSAYLAAQSALAYEKIKDYEKSAKMFKKAISLKPERVDYKYNLAVVYDEMGNYSKAIDAYYDVIKSYSNGDSNNIQTSSIEQIRKRIDSIKSIL